MSELYIEFFGTLVFLLSIVLTANPLIIGGVLALLVYIYNGMFNPAVTLMFVSSGKIKMDKAINIILVQILGGLAAYQLSKHIKL
jgi:glycerol uptake facilitator-like aquaporin